MQTLECRKAHQICAMSRTLDAGRFEQEHADAHVMAVEDHEGPVAECSLWWSEVPPFAHRRVGVIGHYRAAKGSAAQMLLQKQQIEDVVLSNPALKEFMDAEGTEPEIAADVIDLVKSKPFGKKLGRNVKGFVSIMEHPLAEPPDLPVDQPKGDWGVRVIAVEGRFAMSLWRRLEGETMVYPNAVVEKKFGVAVNDTLPTVHSLSLNG